MSTTSFNEEYRSKLKSADEAIRAIRSGQRIFIGSSCGEPQYLVRSLINYVERKPTALFDAELVQVWSLGIAPYTDEKFKDNFRLNSFFITENSRNAINRAAADYTPIFLSAVPELFARGIVPIDVALIQTSLPDSDGNMSLGISVDIVKAATKTASLSPSLLILPVRARNAMSGDSQNCSARGT